jgi:hypothetical protein
MRKTELFLLSFFGGAVMTLCAEVQSNPGDKTIGEHYWPIIAQSTDIYVNDITDKKKTIPDDMELKKYHEINFPVVQALKGERCENISVRIYLETENVCHFKSFYNGRRAILFVKKLYDRHKSGYDNYFANYKTERSLIFFESTLADSIAAEVEFQCEILQKALYANFFADEELGEKVKSLIGDMTDAEKETQAFEELEKLGKAAVPYIILSMDNFNELPIKRISLINNFPGAFEGVRHYGPHLVVDALAAILNQINGESFGNISNGSDTTNAQRNHAIDGWRIYLYYSYINE